jgi:hypothetical protein
MKIDQVLKFCYFIRWMKKNLLAIVYLVFFAGCARQANVTHEYSAGESDGEFQYERSKLKDELVSYPDKTPYDVDASLHKAYIGGFKEGWDLTIEYGDAVLGVLVAIPEEFTNNPQGEKAWKEGFNAAQGAVSSRVTALYKKYQIERSKLTLETVPYPNATPYDTDAPSRKAYLDGLKAGWDVTIKQWITSQDVPIEYNTPVLEKAWSSGYDAGQKAVLDRVDIKEPNPTNSAPMSAQQK